MAEADPKGTEVQDQTESEEASKTETRDEPRLPWGGQRDKVLFPPNFPIDTNIKPGEFVLRTLFAEFTVLTEKKIDHVIGESVEKLLSKSLQRRDDAQFDQLLTAISCVAEHSLPSLLKALFGWYNRQYSLSLPEWRQRHKNRSGEKDYLLEKRDLAVDFIFCLVLIEVLKQLPYHPGHDDLISHIIEQAFKRFRYKETVPNNPNAANQDIIADLYAEVIGVLAISRFHAVRCRFISDLRELRSKEQNPFTTHSIISLLMGMKFFRVKMHPIEEFEACVTFLQECGNYFLEVKDKDIKHALAGLFVEILLPVAAVVKNEVNVPVLKNFVESLYTTTMDLSTKKKHSLALFPMLTCLLCVSRKQFFLTNWHSFLSMCLQQLKNRDPKMSRVALESLYRLLWVYMIRIKCESNTTTQSRLQSIVNSLFPKGAKILIPRDTPLNIFVKIIQFIAQERLDFAMKEIVFDLLCVGRQVKVLYPERMSVGLRSFLVVADSLQQKEGEPPMPQTIGVLPSGSTIRAKKTFINKMLTENVARTIGMSSFYPQIRRAFDSILRVLDREVGRNLMMTKPENVNKDAEELMIGDRKAKIDLFRTCVAAIPRLIPEGMSRQDLVDMLTRLTIHMDEKLRELALQSLQNLVVDFSDWREDVLHGFIQFVQRELSDIFPHYLESGLRILLQFLTQWRTSSQQPNANKEKSDEISELSAHKLPFDRSPHANVLNEVEGFSLVMLCSCRPFTRKLAVCILKEVRTLFGVLGFSKVDDQCVIDVLDRSIPSIIEKVLPNLPPQEKLVVQSASNIDLQWLCDRTSSVWVSGYHDNDTQNKSSHNHHSFQGFDPWVACLSSFLSHDCIMTSCPHATVYSWPIVHSRLTALYPYVDPNATLSEGRPSSLLRSSGSKKTTIERVLYMNLWHNYVVFACRVAPPSGSSSQRSASPELGSSPESSSSERYILRPESLGSSNASTLFKLIVPLIRCEITDMKDIIVNGLGRTNPDAFRSLLEELLPHIKEAIDRKQDKVARKRRVGRDSLRLQLARVFEMLAKNGTFAHSNTGAIDRDSHSLSSTFVEYIDGARLFLDSEGDREEYILQAIRLHFGGFVMQLIRNTPVEHRKQLLSRDLRYSLFFLFASWSGKFGLMFGAVDRRSNKEDSYTSLELSAVQAMSAVLCCGPVFDPSALNEDGYIYSWLNALLQSQHENVYQLARDTLILLLEYNPEFTPDSSALLEWVIDCCYTGPIQVADGCLRALASVFQNREYPCDHVAMLNIALLYLGCPRIHIHEAAVQLLQLLYKRFFLDDVIHTEGEDRNPTKHMANMFDVLLSTSYNSCQLSMSEQLSRLHPELTMPLFSEITGRFQSARSPIRQVLLQYLLPWLYNLELVDPNTPCTTGDLVDPPQDAAFPLKGEGWGSTQATDMVLNNLFYITSKFGDDHPRELEHLWAALVSHWPNNMRVIIRYLIIVTGIAPNELLTHAKRVIVFLGRTKPEQLVDELMVELQMVEGLHFNIERTETPPFFRLTSQKKSDEAEEHAQYTDTSQGLEKGQLHTKRRNTVDEAVGREYTPRTNSAGSLRSTSSTSSYGSVKAEKAAEDDHRPATPSPSFFKSGDEPSSEGFVPYPPLPMPAYGGYFAPLTEFLPDNNGQIQGFHRCNLAVLLLTDLVVDGLDVDWTIHLPLMLHIIFLGLDNSRGVVYEHCKKLLLNLMLVLSVEVSKVKVARMILGNRVLSEEFSLTLPAVGATKEIDGGNVTFGLGLAAQSTLSINSVATITPESVIIGLDIESMTTAEEVTRGLIDFIANKQSKPLWNFEDITAKVLNIRSAEQLVYFLRHVVKLFGEHLNVPLLSHRWAQIALQLALSCSSRHYAGRSLQIFRALRVPLTTRMLSDILSRLVETIAEQGEDMQGYVTEIILTLEWAVDNIDVDVKPMDIWKDIFMSTPNLNKEFKSEIKKSATVTLRPPAQHHTRSTSMSLSALTRRALAPAASEMKETRPKSQTDADSRRITNLSRSRSAQSLKNMQEISTEEDKLTILAQMFWLAVSMLESDYEYEFLLAVSLLEKILQRLQPGRPECRDKLDKILQQIKWPNFVGLQAMLLKGCTSAATAEATWTLLSKLTICTKASVVDPNPVTGFPMNVVALLPYLVHHYEEPNDLCREAANNIAQICPCINPPKRMDNLATVMSLYSLGTFNKDSQQWTKCVIKYLLDEYAVLNLNMMAFLIEVLEKGPSSCQAAVLQILHCLLNYIDLNQSHIQSINEVLLGRVARYVEGNHWKEVLKILKLAVTNSSVYADPPRSTSTNTISETASLSSHTSFAEAEVSFKKELPGRTLEFTFDLSDTPIIGRKLVESRSVSKSSGGLVEKNMTEETCERRGTKLGHDNMTSGWKRPHFSQARTRERLVNLLTCYGQRVGLPKSPSVIFSQSSDTMERQASMCSSSEEASLSEGVTGEVKLDDSNTSEMMIMRTFDFLNKEEEEDPEGQASAFISWPLRSVTSQGSIEESEPRPSSRQEDSYLQSSDDEEAKQTTSSEGATEEDLSHTELASNTSIIVQTISPVESRLRMPSSPLSGSTHSIHSVGSEADVGDLSPGNASPNFSNMAAAFLSIQSDEIEDIWKTHIAQVVGDSGGMIAVNSYHFFVRLYKELRRKLTTVTKEACYYLGKTEEMRCIATQFLNILELLLSQTDCAHVYTEAETLSSCRLLQQHKFCVLEMNETYEMYLLRREQAVEVLDSIKSSVKLQSLGENVHDWCDEEQKVELCRCLYKLHFQLVLLFESYSKLTAILSGALKAAGVTDLSRDITELKQELAKAIAEVESEQGSPVPIDSSRLSKEDGECHLVEYINNKQFTRAVMLVRALRSVWHHDVFGMNSDDDIPAILSIFCRHVAERKPGLVVITRSENNLSEICGRLMELNINLTSFQHRIEASSKEERESVLRRGDSSTL